MNFTIQNAEGNRGLEYRESGPISFYIGDGL